jgi:RNA polymerase sigma factor (sigma-70 family)
LPVSEPPEDRFRVLFDEQFRSIYGYALRRASSPEAAADVVAETFTTAWRRFSDVPEGKQARLWLYGVAARVLANTRRGEQRRDRLIDKLGALAAERIRSDTSHLGDPLGVRVQEALDSLPSRDREVLVLSAWEQLTPAEIAVVLDVPPATVRTRLHRARRRVRAHLNGLPADRTDPSGQAPRLLFPGHGGVT